MIAHRDRAAALMAHGWTRREAERLALICLHSGVCFRSQYLAFIGRTPRWHTASSGDAAMRWSRAVERVPAPALPAGEPERGRTALRSPRSGRPPAAFRRAVAAERRPTLAAARERTTTSTPFPSRPVRPRSRTTSARRGERRSSLCVEQPNCRRRSRWCAMVGPRLAGSRGWSLRLLTGARSIPVVTLRTTSAGR